MSSASWGAAIVAGPLPGERSDDAPPSVRMCRLRRWEHAVDVIAADGAAITLGALVPKPLQCSESVRAEL